MKKFRLSVTNNIFRLLFIVKRSYNQVCLSTAGIWTSNKRLYPVLIYIPDAPSLRHIHFIFINL